MAIANRGLRFGLNAWVETAAELSRRRALVRSMTPEARAMRRALNSWCGRVDERRQLLRATAALRHREVFVALNTWRSYARERRSRSAKIGGVLDTLSPQGRAMRRAFNSWAPLVSERAALRRGAMAIKNREVKMAINSWAAAAAERGAALALVRRATAGIRHRGLRLAVNGWVEAARELGQRRRLLLSVVSPELRAVRRAYNC